MNNNYLGLNKNANLFFLIQGTFFYEWKVDIYTENNLCVLHLQYVELELELYTMKGQEDYNNYFTNK